MIAIVDYGMGNLGSIQNMLRKLGVDSIITSSKSVIQDASKLILPGVGAFDTGISKLKELDLVQTLNDKVLTDKTPILGICLGVQLMTKKSQEGELDGLGWFDAETIKFNFNNIDGKFTLPNMGWRDTYTISDTNLMRNMPHNPRFYYVHSYYLKANDPTIVSLEANYGFKYCVGLEKKNILGVQFHPEKSHKFGMCLYSNFVNNY